MRSACYIATVIAAICCVSRITIAQEKPESATPPEKVSSDTSTRPRSEDLVPSQTSAVSVSPANPGPGTILPQGSPTPQPYPYPYYPQPYYPYPYPPGYPGAYPQSWAARPPATKKTTWYGWQTLIGVVAGDIVTIIGNSSNTEVLAYIGVGGHVLTGPIVHWAHGYVGKGFASLGLNVGLPGQGLLSGLAISAGGADAGGVVIGFILGGIGYIVAPTLDISLLSTETVDEANTTPRGARALVPSSVALMPMLDQNRRGLMLVGRF